MKKGFKAIQVSHYPNDMMLGNLHPIINITIVIIMIVIIIISFTYFLVTPSRLVDNPPSDGGSCCYSLFGSSCQKKGV